jgi:hypothetical protein
MGRGNRAPTGRTAACRTRRYLAGWHVDGGLLADWHVGRFQRARYVSECSGERTCGCGGVTDRRDAGAVGPRSSGYVGPACQSPFLHITGRAIVLCSVQCSIFSVQRNLAV